MRCFKDGALWSPMPLLAVAASAIMAAPASAARPVIEAAPKVVSAGDTVRVTVRAPEGAWRCSLRGAMGKGKTKAMREGSRVRYQFSVSSKAKRGRHTVNVVCDNESAVLRFQVRNKNRKASGWLIKGRVRATVLDPGAFGERDEPAATDPSTPATPEPAAAPPAPARPVVNPAVVRAQILNCVNDLRTQLGLAALAHDPVLEQAAQLHAEQMAVHGFFSHTDQEGRNSSDRVRAIDPSYSYIGENIANGYLSSADACAAWTNSPGHYANMTRTSFGRIGTGYAQNAAGHPYYVQVFSS